MKARIKEMIMDVEYIKSAIESFAERHPMALQRGSEYVSLDDDAQTDAIELVGDIFDNIIEDSEDEE